MMVDMSETLALAEQIGSAGFGRRAATSVSTDQTVALAMALLELHAIAVFASEHLVALKDERAAMIFASPATLTAHDTLARALARLGYVTLKTGEQTDGQSQD